MKRSEINAIMAEADEFIRRHGFVLPPFAYWSAESWRSRGPEVAEIVRRRLGWDITDYGVGRFAEVGLFLFTLRNGDPAAVAAGGGKVYAEKLLISDANQVAPMHFHKSKTEDIINRGGGDLAIQVYNATPNGNLDDTPVVQWMDGVERTFKAGEVVVLKPGESITLTPGVYHKFWGERARVLIGEVSSVNDDATDNFFLDPIGRFPTVDEDEAPRALLVSDYDRWYRHA
ncbi:MAG TPA: D-lyxose/D-mannose family sugar isomerase [Azospirillaceae bacterium]|nr:D-lyxose/D-mannose family sugar isomerase [Azospirillaceae bacterium]